MHIPDGILPGVICIAGYATAAGLTTYTLHKINQRPDPQAGVPRASLLAVAFFVASWIHIPIPPTSVHLVLNGLLGAMLGYYAFPAILVGLFFQAVMFQHGGLTTLGVNATIIGGPALLSAALFQLRTLITTPIASFLAGASGLGLSVGLFYFLVLTTLPTNLDAATEQVALTALVIAYLPLIVLEGVFTVMLVLFLQRVHAAVLETR